MYYIDLLFISCAIKPDFDSYRRLYDIANILHSLGLIRKVQVTEARGRKPAFQYIGPDVAGVELTEEDKRLDIFTKQEL